MESNWKWVTASGLPRRLVAVWIVFTAVAAGFLVEQALFYGGRGLLLALELRAPDGDPTTIIVVYMFGVFFPILLIVLLLSVTEVRIGVGPAGLRLISRLRTMDVRWDALGPGGTTPTGEWGTIRRGQSELRGPFYFWVTREQARAILSHPEAPATLFPPEYWRWIGLPPPDYRRAPN